MIPPKDPYNSTSARARRSSRAIVLFSRRSRARASSAGQFEMGRDPVCSGGEASELVYASRRSFAARMKSSGGGSSNSRSTVFASLQRGHALVLRGSAH